MYGPFNIPIFFIKQNYLMVWLISRSNYTSYYLRGLFCCQDLLYIPNQYNSNTSSKQLLVQCGGFAPITFSKITFYKSDQTLANSDLTCSRWSTTRLLWDRGNERHVSLFMSWSWGKLIASQSFRLSRMNSWDFYGRSQADFLKWLHYLSI